jgi:hypothetical protein
LTADHRGYSRIKPKPTTLRFARGQATALRHEEKLNGFRHADAKKTKAKMLTTKN